MKALVTGATGFVGSHLAEALLEKGAQVRALARGPDRLRWLAGIPDVETVFGTLDDRESLDAAARGVEVIYHCAGVVKADRPEIYHRVNGAGTKNLLEAALAHAEGLKRFVYVSSQAAAGPSRLDRPTREEDPPRPITPYGESKRAGEEQCERLRDRLPITVVRPPAVYGPRDVDILAFFKLASAGVVPIPGLGERKVSVVYVKDLVRGILLAGEHPAARGETFFITSGDHTWPEVAGALREAVGRCFPLPIPAAVFHGAALLGELYGRIFRQPVALNRHKARELTRRAWLCSREKARVMLGYEPGPTLAEGMKETAAWYRSEGWLRGKKS
jgi:nucleoside-diphosphate-sugar epimerase